MKALSIASLAALAVAGTACSQATAPDETTETAIEPTPVSAPVDDGFNLGMPGDPGTATVADDGFNLSVPSIGAAPAGDGFNLPADLPTTSGLDVPTIDTPLSEEPEPVAEDDPDAIIRLP